MENEKIILSPALGDKQRKELNEVVHRQFSRDNQIETWIELKDSEKNTLGYSLVFRNIKRTPMHVWVVESEPVNPDLDVLMELNEKARHLFEEDGYYGVKFGGQLESIINRSLWPPFGYDYPTTIIERAAFYWCEIATKQAFNNGNKRTAILMAMNYLNANGYEFNSDHLSDKELYKLTIKIANKELDKQDVYNLIFNNVSIRLISNGGGTEHE